MTASWVLTWPIDYPFAESNNSGDTKNRYDDVDNSIADKNEAIPGHNPPVVGITGSGVSITCLQCCFFMEPLSENDQVPEELTGKNRNRLSSIGGNSAYSGDPFSGLAEDYLCKWVVLCGDQLGRVYQFDIGDALHQLRCFDDNTKPLIPTSSLAAYQQHTLSNFCDGLDEKKTRYLESQLHRPEGSRSGASNKKMIEVLGYRGVNISHLKRLRMWYAYVGGSAVAAITALQKSTIMFPCPKKVQKNSELILEPYSVVTANEVSYFAHCMYNAY